MVKIENVMNYLLFNIILIPSYFTTKGFFFIFNQSLTDKLLQLYIINI